AWGYTPAARPADDTFACGVLPPVRPPTAPSRTPRCRRTSGRPPPLRLDFQSSNRRRNSARLADTPCRTARRSDSWALSSLGHATPPVACEPLVEVLGSRQSPGSRHFDVDLEPRPLPSTGVTRLPRYYEPPRHPKRPGLSLAGIRLGHAPTAGVSRVASDLLCRHAVATTPVGPRVGSSYSPEKPVTAAFPMHLLGRLPHCAFRGLLGVHSRYGLPARGVARSDPLHRRLRQFCYLHRRSDCYRLEQQLPGGNFTH